MDERIRDRIEDAEAAEAEVETEVEAEAEAIGAEDCPEDREAALDRREQAVIRRELCAAAVEALRERGLSTRLAELLDYADAAACERSLALVEEVVREAIERGVDERIASSRNPLRRQASEEGALMARVRGVMGLKD